MRTVMRLFFLIIILLYASAGMNLSALALGHDLCVQKEKRIECYCRSDACTIYVSTKDNNQRLRIYCAEKTKKYYKDHTVLGSTKGYAKVHEKHKHSVSFRLKKNVPDEASHTIIITCHHKCKHNCPIKGPDIAKR